MSEEEYSINWNSSIAWNHYNPKWLMEKMDAECQNAPDDPSASQIFDVGDVRQAFRDGFKAGLVFRITGDVPNDGGQWE